LLGLQAGEVTAVGLDLDPKTMNVRGRVQLVVYPERLIARLGEDQKKTAEDVMRSREQRRAALQRLIEHGLRAQLRSGSLLTGQLYVAFDYFPDAPKVSLNWNQEVPELPAVPSTLPEIEAKLTGIIAKLDKLPFEAIGRDVTAALASLDGTLRDAS